MYQRRLCTELKKATVERIHSVLASTNVHDKYSLAAKETSSLILTEDDGEIDVTLFMQIKVC